MTRDEHRQQTLKWFGKLFCCQRQDDYMRLVSESYDQMVVGIAGGFMLTRPPRDVAFSLAGGILAAHFDNVLQQRKGS